MERSIAEIVNRSLRSLIEKHSFRQQNEVNDGDTYSIDYASEHFVVRLEKYRAAFDATLYKHGNPDEQINLFNLLAYFSHPRLDAPVSEYFHDEVNIEERYRKQLTHVATTLDQHFTAINEFFSSGDYASRIADVEEFMLNKYPGLFKKC